MEHIIVERSFETPLTAEAVREFQANTGCLDLYRVTLLRSYLSGDGRTLFCVYDAPDAEAVRTVNRNERVPFDRVYPASLHGPGQ